MNSSRIAFLACLFAFSFAICSPASADEKKNTDKPAETKKDKQKSKITVAKDVTFFTKPLDKNGYVDYAAALNKLYSKGVTPENNAVVLMYKAFGPKPDGTTQQPDQFFELLGMKKPPAEGEYFKDLRDILTDQGIKRTDDAWQQLLDEQGKSTKRPWKDGELKMVAHWIKVNKGPLKHIEEAVTRPFNYSPLVIPIDENGKSSGLIATLLPGIQESRSFARVLVARALNHLGEGRVQEAWNDLVVVRKLGRLIGQGPTLIEALVGIAIENMGSHALVLLVEHSKPNAKQVAKYLAELDKVDKSHPLSNMHDKVNTTERSMYIDCVQLLARGDLTIEQLAGVSGGDSALTGIVQKYATGLVHWDIVLREGNKWYDRTVKVMRIDDYGQRKIEAAKVTRDIQKMAIEARGPLNILTFLDPKNGRKAASEYMGKVMVALLLPAVQRARIAQDRAVQNGRLLRISLALAAYHEEHGQYPAKLSAIKNTLNPIPKDVFGDALTYKLTEKGYVVYSIGNNGKDENGRWYDDVPSGDDVNVRMPVPIKD
jgi:hypothetical protein